MTSTVSTGGVARWLLPTGIYVLLSTPLLWLVFAIATNALGPDPAEAVMEFTGEWALRLLLLTLCARPFARWGRPLLMRFRRSLGLFCFLYASLHLLTFGQVYIGWDGVILLEELAERPYVLVGFSAWVVLLPLAITSTKGLRRRMGARWRQLHQGIYLALVMAWLHLLWLVRSDYGEAVIYGVFAALLLVWRVQQVQVKRAR